jgi:molybdopterin converting factor small subunit
MKINVKISSIMRQDANWKEIIEVEGSTPMECTDNLVKKYPGIRRWIYDKKGDMWPRLQYYVNNEIIYPQELNNPLKEGDELFILLNIGGG